MLVTGALQLEKIIGAFNSDREENVRQLNSLFEMDSSDDAPDDGEGKEVSFFFSNKDVMLKCAHWP